jgi:ABC-2 type transport system permease protein
MAGRDLEVNAAGQDGDEHDENTAGRGGGMSAGLSAGGSTAEPDGGGAARPAGGSTAEPAGGSTAGPGGGGSATVRVGPSVFVRLKLRLIAGNLRGSTSRVLGFVFTLIAAIAMATLGFFLMASLRLAPEDIALDVGILLFTVFLVGWTVTPLLAFGLDDTLDPSRLSLFPLRTGQLAVGMFATSITGVWPIATLIIMIGAVAGLATGIGGVLLGVVAVLLLFALCIVTSRLVTTALSGILRTRRGRDVLAVSVIFFILAAQLPNLLLNGGTSGDPLALLHGGASLLRWTPPGMAAHAIADGGVTAVVELAVLAVLVAVIGRLWIMALRRALVSADASTEGASVRNSKGLLARVLPDGPLAAVVTKELKYARRDPRGRVGWFAAIAVTGIMAFSLSRDQNGTGSIALAIAPACIGGVLIGLQSANAFGIDGRSLWMNSVVYGSERDWRTDLAGRHLAVATIAAPLLALIAVVAAFLAGDLLWAVPGALAAWGILGVGLGTGALTSVFLPYTVPERLNAFTGAAPGQGGIAFLASFGALIGGALVALPIALPVLLGLPWVSVLAVPYGLLISWGGRRIAGNAAFRRYPQILGAIAHSS